MNGRRAWAIIAGIVLAWDIWADEGDTLSEVCWALRKSYPRTTFAIMASILLHLAAGDHGTLSKIDLFGKLVHPIRSTRRLFK